MKFKTVILLALAMGCGLIAMLGVQQILSGGSQAPETVKVLVAKQEITPGMELGENLVEFQDWAASTVPPGAVTDPKDFEKRALKVRAFPGEVILQAKLGEKGAFGASSAIVMGMRVVSVPVNNTSAISGMIRPGDRVDILVTYKDQKPGGKTVSRTKTVLEYIEVFAVDRVRDTEGGDSTKGAKAENISVIVTPKQSLVLMQYVNKGTLQMALRHPEDRKEAKETAVDDTNSDEVDAPNRIADKEPAPKVEVLTPVPAKPESFKEFLNAATPPESAAPAEKKFWDIKIYEGETLRVEKVELPEEPASQAKSPSLIPVNSSTGKPAATAA